MHGHLIIGLLPFPAESQDCFAAHCRTSLAVILYFILILSMKYVMLRLLLASLACRLLSRQQSEPFMG